MAGFHWEKESVVPPAKARDWFFDLREDDHDTPRHRAHRGNKPPAPGDGRKIVSRSADTIVTQDTWNSGKSSFRFTVRKVGTDAITLDGEGMGGKMRSHATMRFAPSGAGSRISMDSEFQASGFLKLMMPLFMGKFKKTIDEDMDIHVADMQDEWKTKPW